LIENFSNIGKPITETLERDKWKFSWGGVQNIAFEKPIQRFTTAGILMHLCLEPETVVETDTGDLALGAILSQLQDKRHYPVAFHS